MDGFPSMDRHLRGRVRAVRNLTGKATEANSGEVLLAGPHNRDSTAEAEREDSLGPNRLW